MGLPEWFAIIWLVAVRALACGSSEGGETARRVRGWIGGSLVVYWLATIVALYVTWSAVGASAISGMHGRYLTLVLILVVPLLAGLARPWFAISERSTGSRRSRSARSLPARSSPTPPSHYYGDAPWTAVAHVSSGSSSLPGRSCRDESRQLGAAAQRAYDSFAHVERPARPGRRGLRCRARGSRAELRVQAQPATPTDATPVRHDRGRCAAEHAAGAERAERADRCACRYYGGAVAGPRARQRCPGRPRAGAASRRLRRRDDRPGDDRCGPCERKRALIGTVCTRCFPRSATRTAAASSCSD